MGRSLGLVLLLLFAARGAGALDVFLHAAAEHAVLADDDLVARFDEIDEAGFHAGTNDKENENEKEKKMHACLPVGKMLHQVMAKRVFQKEKEKALASDTNKQTVDAEYKPCNKYLKQYALHKVLR